MTPREHLFRADIALRQASAAHRAARRALRWTSMAAWVDLISAWAKLGDARGEYGWALSRQARGYTTLLLQPA